MRVPKYEPQVGTPTPPSVRMGSAPNEEAFGAGIGDALQKAGAKLASIAARQQEEADRAEFMLMSAQADAFAEETYANEANNPDYEGTINRFQETFRKYGEGYMQRVPDRLKQKAEQLLEMKRLSYEGKFKGLFLAKQTDAIKSGYMKIYDTLVTGNKKEELLKAIPTFTQYSAQEREKLLQTGVEKIDKQVKELQYDDLVGIFSKNPWAKVDKTKYPLFDNRDWDKIDRFRKGEIRQRQADARLAKAEHKEAVWKSIYSTYGSASNMQEFRSGVNKHLANGDINALEYDKILSVFESKLFDRFAEGIYGSDISNFDSEDVKNIGESLGLSGESLAKGQTLLDAVRKGKFEEVAMNLGPDQDPATALRYWGANPEEIAETRRSWASMYKKEHGEMYDAKFNEVMSKVNSGAYDSDPGALLVEFGQFKNEDVTSLQKALANRTSPDKRDDLPYIKGVAGDIEESIRKSLTDGGKSTNPAVLARAEKSVSMFWNQYNSLLNQAGGMGKVSTTELVEQLHELRKQVIVGERTRFGFRSDVSVPMYQMDFLTSREAGLGWRLDRKRNLLVRVSRGKNVIFTNSDEDWEPPK
jgi:hypothetical protein